MSGGGSRYLIYIFSIGHGSYRSSAAFVSRDQDAGERAAPRRRVLTRALRGSILLEELETGVLIVPRVSTRLRLHRQAVYKPLLATIRRQRLRKHSVLRVNIPPVRSFVCVFISFFQFFSFLFRDRRC